MPPSYLVTSMSNSREEANISTIIRDLKGAEREKLHSTINNIFYEYSATDIQVFLILPTTLRTDLHQPNYTFNLLSQFGPHLDLDHGFDAPIHAHDDMRTFSQWFSAIWDRHKLDLYQITHD